MDSDVPPLSDPLPVAVRAPDDDRFAEQLFREVSEVGRGKRSAIIATCAVVMLTTAYVDYSIWNEVSLSLFYAFPIAGATWYGSRAWGASFAFVGAALWGASDHLSGHRYTHDAILYWNTGVRLAYFLIISHLLARLQTLLSRERNESETDPLTGILNRAGWYEAAAIEIRRSRRERRPLAVAYIDLDDFKAVNDLRGHEEGDRVLRVVADTLRGSLRHGDAVARLGGDEFVVLLADCAPASAYSVVAKLHGALTEAVASDSPRVGFSIGVATFRRAPSSVEEIVRCADHAMYEVKHSGKGAVSRATSRVMS